MKKIFYTILAAGLCLTVNSCFPENLPEAGEPRHQVTELKGVPGDEEASLTWSVPEGWNPTDYLVTYTTSSEQKVYTGGAQEYKVSDLENGKSYVFSVQAIYGELFSNPVEVTVKPVTARLAVDNIETDAYDSAVMLSWTKPSTLLTSYKLTYYATGDEANAQTVTIDADKEEYEVTGLTNDLTYTFSLVAVYPKGDSEPTVVKALPSLAIPYFVDRTKAAAGQPITFTFNREGYPSATDVKWIFPDNSVLNGDVVKGGIWSTGNQTVVLSINFRGKEKKWNIEFSIREYVIDFSSYEQQGANYEGLKASCPVFSPDGTTVYEVTFNKKSVLYALDTDSGELKWKFIPDADSPSYNMMTVNPMTGDIYYGTTTEKQFYAVTSEGALKWKFTEAGSMKSAAPAVSADGTVVFIGDAVGNVFAIDAASGAKKWSSALGKAAAALLVNGDELVAGATDGTVKFLKASDGTEIKSLKFAAITDITGFAVAADKETVYVPLKTAMGSFSLKTREILVASFAVADDNLYEPVVSPINGDVFVASKDGSVYCLDKDLTAKKWSYAHSVGKNSFNYSHPVVDSEGNFYVTSGQKGNTTYVFAPDGTVKSQWTYGSSDPQKQMGGNNLLNGVFYCGFVGASGESGAFVGKYVGAERGAGWSSHGGDICGSCCLK